MSAYSNPNECGKFLITHLTGKVYIYLAITWVMPKDIAYIGSTLRMSSGYERLLGNRTRQFRLADQGLEAIAKDKFSVIIVDDVLAAGSLDLPPEIAISDHPGIACHVIRQIRQTPLNRDTPILANVVEVEAYTPKEIYERAGATKCVEGLFLIVEEISRLP